MKTVFTPKPDFQTANLYLSAEQSYLEKKTPKFLKPLAPSVASTNGAAGTRVKQIFEEKKLFKD